MKLAAWCCGSPGNDSCSRTSPKQSRDHCASWCDTDRLAWTHSEPGKRTCTRSCGWAQCRSWWPEARRYAARVIVS